jgi:hypothetical protein
VATWAINYAISTIDPETLIDIKEYILQVAAGSLAIIGALSVWLGRVWSKRIESREQARHAKALESVKADLTKSVNIEIARLQNELAILREKTLGAHNLKIQLYRDVTEPMSEFMLLIEQHRLTQETLRKFNLERARSYARLAMFAPQDVLDAYDALVDYLNDHLEGQHAYDWSVLRGLIHVYLNAARRDVGIGAGEIVYKGHR